LRYGGVAIFVTVPRQRTSYLGERCPRNAFLCGCLGTALPSLGHSAGTHRNAKERERKDNEDKEIMCITEHGFSDYILSC
jgi:hypothetical protein